MNLNQKNMKITFKTSKGIPIKISREKTDPICMKASIGGNEQYGYYLVFRGDSMQEMEQMLIDTTEAFKQAHKRFKEQNN